MKSQHSAEGHRLRVGRHCHHNQDNRGAFGHSSHESVASARAAERARKRPTLVALLKSKIFQKTSPESPGRVGLRTSAAAHMQDFHYLAAQDRLAPLPSGLASGPQNLFKLWKKKKKLAYF